MQSSKKIINFAVKMKISELTEIFERFAPLNLQEAYDNSGLQIQPVPDEELTGVLLCLDVTESTISEAERKHCNLIVSHHPLLFRSPKKITTNDYVGRCICSSIKKGITLYAAHTNLDNAKDGVNFMMAEKLGLKNFSFLLASDNSGNGGAGIKGELPETLNKEQFVNLLKSVFGVECARVNDWTGNSVRNVALCGGAGAFLISEALKNKADAFVTGELGYHQFFGQEDNILLVELGHYETEQYTLEIFRKIISGADASIPLFVTEEKTNPVRYF